jgi:hypothetical protein
MGEAELRDCVLSLLGSTVPFRFLTQGEREALAADMTVEDYPAGTPIIRKGETPSSLFIVQKGGVGTYDPEKRHGSRVDFVSPGHYFGEHLVLFGRPYAVEFRAESDTRCCSMEGERFLRLLRDSKAFALSFGTILKDEQGIFSAFERFSAELMKEMTQGYVDIRKLSGFYADLEPALHPLALSQEIDFSALTYAVRRLPENVTRNFAFLLTDDLPTEFGSPAQIFKAIPSKARRRDIWEMIPGKSMVMLRSGTSDLIDFVTCLCLYVLEAKKIRMRLRAASTILRLGSFMAKQAGTFSAQGGIVQVPPGGEAEFLSGLGFSPDEVVGLGRVWPSGIVPRLDDIARHREAFNINVRRQIHNYKRRRAELWTQQIGNATKLFFGYEPMDLPEDIRVHIISSNDHSVTNCLNPALVGRAEEIVRWGREKDHPYAREYWKDSYDLVYALARDYLAGTADERSMRRSEPDRGVYRIKETVSTGIQVQMIDISRLADVAIDPGISEPPKGSRSFIVNIDYAFGEQAEDILRNLVLLFGRRIGSINVIGKAGGVVGSRGDVIVPTAFIEQTSDRFEVLPETGAVDQSGLEPRIPGSVYRGPMLTVAGTLLQNRMMLQFYKHVWGCVGLEMEGTFYARQIADSMRMSLISPDIPVRFVYYISDLPLDSGANLSTPLQVSEGIPPLYGITRHIVSAIFESERKKM